MDRLMQSRETTSPRFVALWTLGAYLLLAAIVYLSLSRTVVELPADPSGHYAHVAAYSVLMLMFCAIYRSTFSRVLVVGSLLALGVGIEFVQGWGGYRNFERADMVADALGLLTGWVVAHALRFVPLTRWARRR